VPATTKVFENILILLSKLRISALLEARIYLEDPKDYSSNYRFCNSCLRLLIMTYKGVRWGALLNLVANGFTVIKINIFLTWQLPNVISVII
jgi:hypothetical protein